MNFLSSLTGCFAMPAAENPTVAMVEAAYRHHDLGWRYINCEVPPQRLGDAVRGARAMGWKGFNCSIPHKIAVIEHIDALGESAEIIGATNCVVDHDGRFVGENTDGKGFVESLRGIAKLDGAKLTVLGAGGAARAIAVEMALAGATEIEIVNRTEQTGVDLAELVDRRTPAQAGFRIWDGDIGFEEGTDIVVNATSIGLFPGVDEVPPIEFAALRSSMIVADVIPNPPNTRFLAMAAERGCRTVNGLGMLVNQAVIGIRYWTGVTVDGEVMKAKLTELFG